jgi:hypothetical protein
MSKLASNNTKQVEAFISKVCQIDSILERLKSAADDHFDTDPEKINWTDVAEISRVAEALQQVSDMVFREGEYAA